MICRNCGKELNDVLISKFDIEGNDYLVKEKIFDETYQDDYKVITFFTDADWTGYGLNSEDNINDVCCPNCSKPLFGEVQYYEKILVVGFCEKRKVGEEE